MPGGTYLRNVNTTKLQLDSTFHIVLVRDGGRRTGIALSGTVGMTGYQPVADDSTVVATPEYRCLVALDKSVPTRTATCVPGFRVKIDGRPGGEHDNSWG